MLLVLPNAALNALISKVAVAEAIGLMEMPAEPVPIALVEVFNTKVPFVTEVVPVKPVLAAVIVNVPVPFAPPTVKLPAPAIRPAVFKVIEPPDLTVTMLAVPPVVKLMLLPKL